MQRTCDDAHAPIPGTDTLTTRLQHYLIILYLQYRQHTVLWTVDGFYFLDSTHDITAVRFYHNYDYQTWHFTVLLFE